MNYHHVRWAVIFLTTQVGTTGIFVLNQSLHSMETFEWGTTEHLCGRLAVIGRWTRELEQVPLFSGSEDGL